MLKSAFLLSNLHREGLALQRREAETTDVLLMSLFSSISCRMLALLLVVLFASSCANRSAGERRLNKHPELSQSLTPKEQALVAQGEIAEGMSPDAVFLAWGRPDRIRTGSRNGRKTETWAYFGSTPVARPAVSVGVGGSPAFYSRFGVHPTFGYGTGVGWNYGTDIDFARHVAREVEFVNDRVVSWERVR